MLTPTEAKAHNAKVELRNYEKRLARIEEVPVPFNKRKPGVRSTLPRINPADRPKRKIYMGGQNVGTRSHNVTSAMPTPADRRNRQVQGITNFAR